MSLRAKTLAIVGVTMAVLLVLLSAVAWAILSQRFSDLELKATRDDMTRVVDDVSERQVRLAGIAGDWAAWDESFAYVTHPNNGFEDTNVKAADFENLGVDFLAYCRLDGTVIGAWVRDASGSVAPAPAEMRRQVAADKALFAYAANGPEHGIMPLSGQPLMMAVQRVASSDRKRQGDGFFIAGVFLGPRLLTQIGASTHLRVGSYVVGAAGTPWDVNASLPVLKRAGGTYAAALDGDSIAGYALLRDLHGAPAVTIRVVQPRSIYATGQRSIEYVVLSLLVLGLVATGTTVAVLERLVLRRMTLLKSEVDRIGGHTDIRVKVPGNDEIGALGNDVNRMLNLLWESEQELLGARSELEDRVEVRTAELRSSQQRYMALVEGMADATISLDLAGRITFVNRRVEMLTNRTREELLDCHYSDLFTAEGVERVGEHLDPDGDPDLTWTLEVEVMTAGDARIPVELHCSPVVGEGGRIVGLQLIAHDVTERKRIESQLVHLASHDHLTNLCNRRRFEEELANRLGLAQRTGRPGAVLWLDIDNFKDINDSLGHRAGDEVLVGLAMELRQRLRGDSFLARLGGDEFAILMSDIDPEQVRSAAERVLTELNTRTMSVDGHAIHVSASMGVVLFPEHGTNVDELLAKADVAMYFAKESGRGRLHVHEPDEAWHVELSSRLSWNERITRALRDNALLVYAQPVVDLASGAVDRYELLVRLRDEDGGVVLPNAFLPAAERLGLIQAIDRWMVTRAIELLRQHPAGDVRLDVNLSGSAFSDPELLPMIERELKRGKVAPARLGLEITETAAISDITRAQDFICRLKALGCRFALDDFGSGFSSFYYLKHLPIDCLKIDGSFVRGLAHSEQDRHLVRALVELCRGLQMHATAEFVEDAATMEVVERLGVDFAQGYHISRPRPIEELLAEAAEGASLAS